MAALAIPQQVQKYFPKHMEPSSWWVRYNPAADSLTIYFAGKPVPSVWRDVDAYAYVGFAEENGTVVTGLLIEHFSQWLLVSDHVQSRLQPA